MFRTRATTVNPVTPWTTSPSPVAPRPTTTTNPVTPWTTSPAPGTAPPGAPLPPGGGGEGWRNAGDQLVNAIGLRKLTLPKVAGLGVLGSLIGAAGEFGDQSDVAGAAGNAVDAVGNLGGSLLGGGAALAGATMLGLSPVGIPALIAASLAAAASGQMGKGLTRSVADGLGFTSSDANAKALNDATNAARAKTMAEVERQKAMMPLMAQQLQIQRQNDQANAGYQAQLIRDQNYQNAVLTGMLNQQANTSQSLSDARNQMMFG